jgi:hypothetical protein
VVDAIDFPDGKFSAALGNVVMLEADYFQTVLQPLLSLLVPAGSTYRLKVRFPAQRERQTERERERDCLRAR